MNEGIDPQRFKKLCNDMSDVKTALMGSEDYRQKGALQRLDETEERSESNERKIDRAWYYVLGASAVIGAIVALISRIIG